MSWRASLTRALACVFFLSQAVLCAKDWKTLKPTGYVSDFANVIDVSSKASLEAYCAKVQQSTGAQMAFVTIPSLEGEPIEDVANDIFRGFGVGQKGKDNGVLLLLVAGDRRFRLEVGHGLEPILPDGLDGEILLSMRPALRSGQYGAALIEAAQRIGTILAQDKGVSIPTSRLPRRHIQEHPIHSIPWPLILGGIFVIFLLFRGGGGGGNFLTGMLIGSLMGGGRGNRGGGYGGFGGSDGGGGFGGFGGGDSGGGGASSNW